MIRCAHCKDRHETVAEVRDCADMGWLAPAPSVDPREVPAGRYAAGDPLAFYKIDRPTEGRWAGYIFVNIQGGDGFYPVRDPRTRRQILAELGRDPKAAMLRYGKEIGSCGHCGRTLTNEASRERGIGPVCADKLGW